MWPAASASLLIWRCILLQRELFALRKPRNRQGRFAVAGVGATPSKLGAVAASLCKTVEKDSAAAYISSLNGGVLVGKAKFPDQVLSALQKSIRRALPEDAIYWAVQLDITGFGNACFNRLKLIVSEDIGLAEPGAVFRLTNAFDDWKKAAGKKLSSSHESSEARELFVQCVHMLATCHHSRLVNNACAIENFMSKAEDTKLDKAMKLAFLDRQTDAKLRTTLASLATAILNHQERRAIYLTGDVYLRTPLNKEERQKGDYAQNGIASLWGLLTALIDNRLATEPKSNAKAAASTAGIATADLKKLKQTIEALHMLFLETPNKLFIMHATLLTLRCLSPNGATKFEADWEGCELPDFSTKQINTYYENAKKEKREVPEYAIDKHTGKGKAQGRDLTHFFDVGCKLENENIADLYRAEAKEKYLEVEKTKGIRQAKSTRFRAERRSKLSKDGGSDEKMESTKKRKAVEIEDESSADSDGDFVRPVIKRVKRNAPKPLQLEESSPEGSEEASDEEGGDENKAAASNNSGLVLEIEKVKLPKKLDSKAKELPFDGSVLAAGQKLEEGKIIFNAVYAQASAGTKPTTYLATVLIPGYKPTDCFVKGPNLKTEYVTGQCLVDQAKEFFGHVHKIGTHRIKLVPDARYHKNLKFDEFLIMKDISQGASVGYTTKTVVGFTVVDHSKGDVIDCVSYFRQKQSLDVDQNLGIFKQYMAVLMLRAVFEVSDSNNHNFLVNTTEKKFLSIDENVIFRGFAKGKMFSHWPAKNVCDAILEFMWKKGGSAYCAEVLAEWKSKATKGKGAYLKKLLDTFGFGDESYYKRVVDNIEALTTMLQAKKLQFARPT